MVSHTLEFIPLICPSRESGQTLSYNFKLSGSIGLYYTCSNAGVHGGGCIGGIMIILSGACMYIN